MSPAPALVANSMFALIAIGIFVVVILVLMGREHEKKLVLAWAEVAQRFDLAQVKPMELIGEVDGISVHADVFHTGSGKNRQTWTRVVIEGGLTRAVGLAKEGFFSRAFGHDIATGDRSFDEAVKVRHARHEAALVTQHAQGLVGTVREHQRFITGLGSAWHALYEFGAYQSALRELRRAAEDWLKALERRSSREGAAFDRVELLAWRTLGEGVLLIDMYEQGGTSLLSGVPESSPPPGTTPWMRMAAWWKRLRG